MVWGRDKIGRPNQSDTTGNNRRQAKKRQTEKELDWQHRGVDRQIIRRYSSHGTQPAGVEFADEEVLAKLRDQGKARQSKARQCTKLPKDMFVLWSACLLGLAPTHQQGVGRRDLGNEMGHHTLPIKNRKRAGLTTSRSGPANHSQILKPWHTTGGSGVCWWGSPREAKGPRQGKTRQGNVLNYQRICLYYEVPVYLA